MSKSCQLVLGDEIDQYQSPPNVNQIREMQKRTRSYDHSIVGLVCTPTTQDGSIWTEYLKGSQGKWFLRCKGCNELSLDSSQTNNLQFESIYDEDLRTYQVKKGSSVLICPKCGHQHKYEDRRWMNQNGGWIHKFPELKDTFETFQFGALASQLKSLSWDYIAQQQLDAGKSSDLSLQMSFDNSIRGLPFHPRKISKADVDNIKENHIWHTAPVLEDLEMVYITCDTMDDYIRYSVWGWSVVDSIYLIEDGEVSYIELSDEKRKEINKQLAEEQKPPVVTLEDVLSKDYLVKDGVGIVPLFLLIDSQRS